MATPAAVLAIQVEANTRSATSSLSKFDTKLRAIDRTTATATTRTTGLTKASNAAGGAMRSAARYAVGAAAAYVSIAKAREAVTTTQNLANTSHILARNLGLSTKQASRWASVAQTRDISTRQLNASFATLTQKLTDARAGSEEALDSFKALGVTQKDLARDGDDFNKTLFTVSDALENAKGSAFRQDAAIGLLGRGYQNLLPIMGQGSEALQKQLTLGDKYGATMGKDAVAAQMKLTAELRESQRAWQGMQVTFTTAVTPAIQAANQQFQRIGRILGSDKLTDADKFRKVSGIIGGWAKKALDAFVRILPKLVEEAGETAPKIAGALVKGFLQADIWGKLAIGGWLISKFGGAAALAGTGKKAGRISSRGFMLGMTAGIVLLGPDLLKEVFNLGRKAGKAVANAFGQSSDPKKISSWGTALKSGIGQIQKNAPGGKLGSEVPAWAKPDWLNEGLTKQEERVREHRRRTAKINQDAWNGNLDIAGRGLDRVNDRTKGGLDRQVGTFQRTKEKVGETTRRQAEQVGGNTNRMVDAVGQGLKILVGNTNKALKGFGAKTLKFAPDFAKGSDGKNYGGLQRGGPINQGAPSGDSVPALLERGEYVLNRKAVAAVGKQRLDHLNFGVASRFQAGGMAGLEPGISRLAKWANQRYGLTVSSGLRPGDSDSFHGRGQAVDLVPPSMNATVGIYNAFKNQLAELFYDPWGGFDSGQRIGAIGGHMDHIHAAIAGAGGPVAMARKLKRLLLKGPDGPLKSMGQSALDKAHKAANSFISKQTPSHGNLGAGAGALSEAEFLALAKRAIKITGASGFSPQGLLTLAMAESSLIPSSINNWDINAKAGNPSGGLMHLTQSNMKAYAHPKLGSNMFNPLASIAASIRYQIDRYGGQVTHSPYQWGGLVGKVLPYAGSFQGGGVVPGPIGAPRAAVVHGGERISEPHHFNSDKAIQALLKEFVANQRAILRMSRREKTAIQAALASAASGQIGGRVHLSGQTPVAGSFASY